MKYFHPEEIAILFDNNRMISWNHFIELIENRSHTTKFVPNERSIKIFETLYNTKLEYKEQNHEKYDFITSDIYLTEEKETGVMFIQKQTKYSIFVAKIKMEIFNLKNIIFCICNINDENKHSIQANFKTVNIIKNDIWFGSVILKIIRFYKEINKYKEEGINKHPLYPTIGTWYFNDSIKETEEETKQKPEETEENETKETKQKPEPTKKKSKLKSILKKHNENKREMFTFFDQSEINKKGILVL